MVRYAELVSVSHGVYCCASGCESWCAMLSKWLLVMVCYAEPVGVCYGVLYWSSGCESWCVMLRQWL